MVEWYFDPGYFDLGDVAGVPSLSARRWSIDKMLDEMNMWGSEIRRQKPRIKKLNL